MNKILLEMVFEKTYEDIKSKLGDDINKDEYYAYLSYEYRDVDLNVEVRDDGVEEIGDFYAERERKQWQHYPDKKDLLLSIIERDESLEYLKALTRQAFGDSFKRSDYGVYLSDEEKYKLRLDELNECCKSIKKHNLKYANELKSKAILDINYAFGKVNYYSSI